MNKQARGSVRNSRQLMLSTETREGGIQTRTDTISHRPTQVLLGSEHGHPWSEDEMPTLCSVNPRKKGWIGVD